MPKQRKATTDDSSAPRNGRLADARDAGRTHAETTKAERRSAPDAVHIASDDSFPASDPPAWIWRRSE